MPADVVVPIPDSGVCAATGFSAESGLPVQFGLIRNHYVGRTFIMPGQQMRRKNVRRKLNAMALEFAGKSVLLVDDSIVRGTTSKEIVQMAKDVGAARVIVASCAPPIRHVNVYGIDMPSRAELVAHNRDEAAIAAAIGAAQARRIVSVLPEPTTLNGERALKIPLEAGYGGDVFAVGGDRL